VRGVRLAGGGGAHPRAAHTAAAAYAEQAGFALAWGRIFFLYGPDEPAGRLVPSVAHGLLAGRPVPTTSGDQVRDFLHVEDAAAAFVALAGSDASGAVNIASGDPVTVREVVDMLARAAGRPELPRPGALPDRAGDPPRLVADVTRLRQEVGLTPRIALYDGLAGTLERLRGSS
jgi:nucleoside-diphosphate-sugar epimerase